MLQHNFKIENTKKRFIVHRILNFTKKTDLHLNMQIRSFV
jgi:hypothetical protein